MGMEEASERRRAKKRKRKAMTIFNVIYFGRYNITNKIA